MAKSRKRKKEIRTTKRSDALKEAIILVPLNYNDGTRVPREQLDEFRDELYAAFHGWTIEGTVRGAYRMRSGEKCVERLQRISIVLAESQLEQLEGMLARLGGKLGQEAMLMKVSDAVVKFVPPMGGGEWP